MEKCNGRIDIKSVNVRYMGVRRRLLMSNAMIPVFQSFLKNHIGNEVLVVNTNIGMEIYYYARHDYSDFIEMSILRYVNGLDRSKLKFKNCLNRDAVYKSFCEALLTFAQYPQVFLAYSKKFVHLKQMNTDSQYVIPVLYGFFEDVLNMLEETGRMPHHKKIEELSRSFKKPDLSQDAVKSLIAEVLLKRHSN